MTLKLGAFSYSRSAIRSGDTSQSRHQSKYCRDSTFITSAPTSPRCRAQSGPAHPIVRSMTLRPRSRSGRRAGSCTGRGLAEPAETPIAIAGWGFRAPDSLGECSPMRATTPSLRAGVPCNLNGWPGTSSLRPPGRVISRKASTARSWALSNRSAIVGTRASGTRNSCPSRNHSSAGRFLSAGTSAASIRSASRKRLSAISRFGSSDSSSTPTRRQKLCHWLGVRAVTPSQPSLVS